MLLVFVINKLLLIINWGFEMYKKCKKEQSINRQKTIETTFLNLLKNKSYENISVSEICEASNIPRKAFYRYFENKEGLLQSLIQHVIEGYNDFYSQIKRDKRTVEGELETFFTFWITEPRKTLLNCLNNNSLLDNLLKFNKNLPIETFLDITKFFPNENPWVSKQILNFAILGLMSIMLDWYNSGCKQTTKEMAKLACRLLEKPLFLNLEDLGILKE